MSIRQGLAMWCPRESALNIAKKVGCVGVIECGKPARKCARKCVEGVVVVCNSGFVGRLVALEVFARSRADEMSAERSEKMPGSFVDVDGWMPSGVDLVFDGEGGACTV